MEYLFRGKTIGGKWVEGDLIHGVRHKKGQLFILPIVDNLANCPGADPLDGYSVIPSTVGMWTGKTDKNGKRIFEADKDQYGDTVVWDNENCCFAFKMKYGLLPFHTIDFKWVEITGTIHD